MITTLLSTNAVAVILYLLWPLIFAGLVAFGKTIIGFGPIGAGIYAMLNRALIPLGLHHALNAVFWFDTAGALAMYHSAKPQKKKLAGSLLLAGAIASFFTGITEPLEFSFMFMAPGLYLIHAFLTGVSAAVCSVLPLRIGFNFSAGLDDYVLSFKAPMALNPLLLIPVGLIFAVIYYVVFRFAISKFDLKTPGREDEEEDEETIEIGDADFATMAKIILVDLGGAANIKELDYCATRVRTEVIDYTLVDEKKINVMP